MAGAIGGPLVEVLENLHHVVGLGDEGDEAHFVAAFGFLGGPFAPLNLLVHSEGLLL